MAIIERHLKESFKMASRMGKVKETKIFTLNRLVLTVFCSIFRNEF